MKQPPRMNQLQKRWAAVWLLHRARVATMQPRNPLPASPMKMRAGGKFQIRKPATQAAKAIATGQSPDERAAERDGDRLEAGDGVDAVHEIEQVDRPDEIERREQRRADAEIDDDAEERHLRQRAEPVEHPDGSEQVAEEAPARRQRPAVVDEAEDGDGQPAAEQRGGEAGVDRTRSEQGHDDAEE